MNITVYNQNGEKVGTRELAPELFEVPLIAGLVHQALLRQLSNERHPIAKVKTRAERRGGGRKPWKQKHTGRARAGSSRSPLWRKGGRTFGPLGREEYSRQMPHKQRVLALLSALSQKAKDKQILGLDAFTVDAPRTKVAAHMLSKIPTERSVLIVIAGAEEMLRKSTRNIPSVKVLYASYLNIADMLKYKTVLFMKDAFDRIEEVWGPLAKELASSRSRKAVRQTNSRSRGRAKKEPTVL